MLYYPAPVHTENHRRAKPAGDPTPGAYNIEDLRRIAQRRLPKGVINIYREEMDRVLAQLGCRSISEVTRDCLLLPGDERFAA